MFNSAKTDAKIFSTYSPMFCIEINDRVREIKVVTCNLKSLQDDTKHAVMKPKTLSMNWSNHKNVHCIIIIIVQCICMHPSGFICQLDKSRDVMKLAS